MTRALRVDHGLGTAARLGRQIVQPRHGVDQRFQAGGDLYVADICIPAPAAGAESMQLRLKRVSHLSGGATESDERAAARRVLDLKALRLDPLRHARQISSREAETVAELFRREPCVIAWRRWILQVLEKLF